ncbi:hypothetical protein ACIRCZ_10965 [Leifsonia sp. NPDC102414]|uniref:hypothetical protein n=1 Tax=unclassified Leifsonia TaxID=2663824 RepID=UPI000A456EA2|nr:hypothetical protein [Leifsonia sp. Root227]
MTMLDDVRAPRGAHPLVSIVVVCAVAGVLLIGGLLGSLALLDALYGKLLVDTLSPLGL